MVSNMKKAMVGTFFETWLTMGGWSHSIGSASEGDELNPPGSATIRTRLDTDQVHQPTK